MSAWLDPLRLALDETAGPVEFFFRNDDVGWSDSRLFKLLDCFERYSASIELAVIPAALTPLLASQLCTRIADAQERIGIHQHGFAHTNHESAGRKCEFGASRTADQQCMDIESGQLKLSTLLGPVVSPIFTPPWNRCTKATGECLTRLGFKVLSRDLTAPTLGLSALQELPIQIDWFAKSKGLNLGRECIGKRIAGTVRNERPVGIMLHHQLMDADERLALAELLALIKTHPHARSCPMHEIVRGTSEAATH
jgi:hypothetical protein